MNSKGLPLVANTPASAAAPSPDRPTDSDRVSLAGALGLELAAAELYEQAAQQLDDDHASIAALMAKQHLAYAHSISGLTGLVSEGAVNSDVVSTLSGDFATSDAQAFGAAARTLENTAVATHTDLLGSYDSIDAIELTASIITVESRHAVALTSLAGFASNLDEMLENGADAFDQSGDNA